MLQKSFSHRGAHVPYWNASRRASEVIPRVDVHSASASCDFKLFPPCTTTVIGYHVYWYLSCQVFMHSSPKSDEFNGGKAVCTALSMFNAIEETRRTCEYVDGTRFRTAFLLTHG